MTKVRAQPAAVETVPVQAGDRADRPVSLLRWIARYASVSPAAGAYLVCRCLGFPWLASLERRLPASGRILDLGCGYGLLAILCGARAPGRRVLGIDILEARLAVGREVVRRQGCPDNVDLVHADLADLPDGPFDAICIAHVLLYRPLGEQRAVLQRCRDRLAPGGVLAVVETVRSPVWKARLARLQENIVVGAKVHLAGDRHWAALSPGSVFLWDAAALCSYLQSLGLRVASERLDRWSHLSHRLFIGVAESEKQG